MKQFLRSSSFHTHHSKEKQKRQREIFLAAISAGLVVVLTWVELRFLGGNSYVFFALFNVNLILLLLVLFLVLRNAIKLVLERRRRLIGSGLRARLVLIFVTLSVIPTLVMFLLSLWFVRASVDYWFQVQVESSMEQALSLGQDFYAAMEGGLERRGNALALKLQDARLSGNNLEQTFVQAHREYELTLTAILSQNGTTLYWLGDPVWNTLWPEIRNSLPWQDIIHKQEYWATLWQSQPFDQVVGIIFLPNRPEILLVGAPAGKNILSRMTQIASGVSEYKKLRTLKYPVKMTLYLVLGLMALLIFLGATWFGFRLAREISRPVQALAAGTQRIAQGDLSVRLRDDSKDELGLLVQSFNRMAADLEQSQTRLTLARHHLEEQFQALATKNQYVQAILENITAGVISLDATGMVTTMNRAAENLLSMDAAQMIGASALDMLAPHHRELVEEVAKLLTSSPGSQWQRRIEIAVRGETIKLLVNAVGLMDAEGRQNGMMAVFENISELEKMQRLDAWKEVARRIAHEIKNPLTPIKLSAQRLERKFGVRLKDDPIFAQCTDLIIRQVEHLQVMVQEFSSFAKLPEVELQPTELLPLIRESMAVFEHSHSHILWVLKEEELPLVSLDVEAMKRVLFNIFLNAADVLEQQTDATVRVFAYTRRSQRRVYLEISDNGPGVNPEEQARMFEPYYSTKRGGTGLGLAIVKSIVTDHHGHIRVRPHEPQGTVFIIELPAVRGE